jgi:bifunctional isochorismate lyase/aryl carrier protein
MKETYFTADSLEDCTQAFQRQLASCGLNLPGLVDGPEDATQPAGVPRRRQGSGFIPALSALLVLDMQNYFLAPESHAWVPSASAIVPGLKALARAYAASRLPIIFTQHLNTPQDAGRMSLWWRELITTHNSLAAIISGFDLSSGIVLQKAQYDAFYGTRLEDTLRQSGVSQVVIGGVMTHLCCETTARAAFMRGFEVFFLIDGTATYNRSFHQATLLNLAHGFAMLATVQELLAQMGGPVAG